MNDKTFNKLTITKMTQVKNKHLKITALGLVAIILASFNNKKLFDGGTISNPNITITGPAIPVIISATSASGCAGTVAYQWQQSFDRVNFVDISNATDSSYQSGPITIITHFRRKAICSGGGTVYTNNVATVTIQ